MRHISLLSSVVFLSCIIHVQCCYYAQEEIEQDVTSTTSFFINSNNMSSSRLIVITGCTKGLGLALVSEFASRGHRVAGCGRNTEVVRALQKQYPSPLHSFEVVDVSNEVAVGKWASTVMTTMGTAPDIVINNAAIAHTRVPLWEVPVNEIDAIYNVNLKGPAYVIRHFAPAMIAKFQKSSSSSGSSASGAGGGSSSSISTADSDKFGLIINLSSYWGRSTSAGVSPYCSTKYGIEGMTKALAQDLGSVSPHTSIAAISMNPGIIHTEMLEGVFGVKGAASYPTKEEWGKVAAPFILKMKMDLNGRSVTVPGF
jgi:NAD(P)-dependent dehydrogenase (short-subunit alcohol dehydrogenase family)